MATELRYEVSGPVTLYECEHITTGTYKVVGEHGGVAVVSTGDHTAVMLCVHCATHLKGTVLDALVTNALIEQLRDEAGAIAKRLVASWQPAEKQDA